MSSAVPLMLPASSSACAKVSAPLRPSRYSGDAAAAYRSASTLSGIFLLMVSAALSVTRQPSSARCTSASRWVFGASGRSPRVSRSGAFS